MDRKIVPNRYVDAKKIRMNEMKDTNQDDGSRPI